MKISTLLLREVLVEWSKCWNTELGVHELPSLNFTMQLSFFSNRRVVWNYPLLPIIFNDNIISVSCPPATVQPLDLLKRRCLLHNASAKWDDPKMYLSVLRNDYCFWIRDLYVCAQRFTELLVSGMEAYFRQICISPHIILGCVLSCFWHLACLHTADSTTV